MLCPHGLDQRICATCRALQSAQHGAPPPPVEAFADIAAPCASDPSHLVFPGQRVRHIDGLGWSCLRCANAARSTATPEGARRSGGKALWLVAGLAVLLIGGCQAVTFLGASADKKFDEVGQAIADEGEPSTSRADNGWATTTTVESIDTTTTSTVSRSDLETMAQIVCDVAIETGDAPDGNWDPQWSGAMSRAEFDASVDQCIAAKEQALIGDAQPVNVDEIVKNPDATAGKAYVMVVNISQFDAATGPCAFRGYWDNTDHEWSFDFRGDNAYFTAGDEETTCPVLDGIDQNDTIRVWTRSSGSYSYDTQIGGSTTAPSFRIIKAEIIRKE